MGELSDLASALLALADGAQSLADELGAPIAPSTELRDLLERELGLDLGSFDAYLQVGAVAEEITRIVVAPYAEAAASLAYAFRDLIEDDEDDAEVERRFHCLDCDVNTVAIGEYYMLRGDVRAKVAEPDAGALCIGCVEKRLGRRLKPDDFMPIAMNYDGYQSRRLRSRVLGLEESPAA